MDAPLWTLIAPLAVILPGATIVTGLTELGAGAMVGGTARLAHGTMQLLLFALGVAGAVTLLRLGPEHLDPARPVGDRVDLVDCVDVPLQVPAAAQVVL